MSELNPTDPFSYLWEVTVFAKPGFLTPHRDWTFYTKGPVQPKFQVVEGGVALRIEQYVGDFEEVVGLFVPGSFVGFFQEKTDELVDTGAEDEEPEFTEPDTNPTTVPRIGEDDDEFTEPGGF
jgi:hypothetical protein